MKVYIVQHDYGCDDGIFVRGVCSTRELAEKAASFYDPYCLEIVEHEVDAINNKFPEGHKYYHVYSFPGQAPIVGQVTPELDDPVQNKFFWQNGEKDSAYIWATSEQQAMEIYDNHNNPSQEH